MAYEAAHRDHLVDAVKVIGSAVVKVQLLPQLRTGACQQLVEDVVVALAFGLKEIVGID